MAGISVELVVCSQVFSYADLEVSVGTGGEYQCIFLQIKLLNILKYSLMVTKLDSKIDRM